MLRLNWTTYRSIPIDMVLISCGQNEPRTQNLCPHFIILFVVRFNVVVFDFLSGVCLIISWLEQASDTNLAYVFMILFVLRVNVGLCIVCIPDNDLIWKIFLW